MVSYKWRGHVRVCGAWQGHVRGHGEWYWRAQAKQAFGVTGRLSKAGCFLYVCKADPWTLEPHTVCMSGIHGDTWVQSKEMQHLAERARCFQPQVSPCQAHSYILNWCIASDAKSSRRPSFALNGPAQLMAPLLCNGARLMAPLLSNDAWLMKPLLSNDARLRHPCSEMMRSWWHSCSAMMREWWHDVWLVPGWCLVHGAPALQRGCATPVPAAVQRMCVHALTCMHACTAHVPACDQVD